MVNSNDSVYRQRIIQRLDNQIIKGKRKYGVLLRNGKGLDIDDRLELLAEELIDVLQHVEHTKELIQHFRVQMYDIIDELADIRHTFLLASECGLSPATAMTASDRLNDVIVRASKLADGVMNIEIHEQGCKEGTNCSVRNHREESNS